MTAPLRVLLYEDSILPSTVIHSSKKVTGADVANLIDERPGKLMELGSSFYVRAGVNDQFQVENDDTGDTVLLTISPGLYTGSTLSAAIDIDSAAAFAANPGYVDPVLSTSYSETTKLFTIASTANTILYFGGAGQRQQQFALTLGFEAVNTAAGTSHVSDNQTFVQDVQFIVWDMEDGDWDGDGDPECFMFFATNLSGAETVTLCGNPTSLGNYPDAWTNSALYRSTISATRSKTNDLYIWFPSTTLLHDAMRYWALVITRGGTQAAMANLKIGVGAAWNNEGDFFNADDYTAANYHTPWTLAPVRSDAVVHAPAGGGSHVTSGPGWEEAVLPFEDWPEGVYKRLESFWDRHGRKIALWVPDSDNIYPADGFPPKAAYGRIQDWSPPRLDNVNDDVSWTIRLRGESMPPDGVL